MNLTLTIGGLLRGVFYPDCSMAGTLSSLTFMQQRSGRRALRIVLISSFTPMQNINRQRADAFTLWPLHAHLPTQ